ncbi:MAG TPA: DEAD/DEAH box helicase, partial [Chloroflexota bacterium]|nr:DEAD/DEAH box helicase [Chloroflexota bacterium]
MSKPELAELLDGREPLESQLAAAAVMQRSGRAIAVLPTGAGKTLLAALPFAAGLVPPRQMVFMTPLRSLTSAQATALREQICLPPGRPWQVRQQTGAVPEDPLFCAPVTVTTFDQALSSALQIAYSTARGRRGINAGAILSAYLVADELHLYPRDQALTTLLWLLKNRPDLPFLLMTATLTRPVAEALAELLRADILPPIGDADR